MEAKPIEVENENKMQDELEKKNIINKGEDINYNMPQKQIEKGYIISNDILCSECKESCLIDIRDYSFNLIGCKNKHNINNVTIENFSNLQKIKKSKKICQKCNKNTDEYYKCITCNNNICSRCKLEHDKEHKIIEYEKINYICNEHYETYAKYCKNCNKDLCLQCENAHKNHKTIYYVDILPKNINNENNKLKEYIDKLNNEINEIIKNLKYIMNNLELYYDISSNIINNCNNNRNYQTLYNINEFIKFNSVIIQDIENIINGNDIDSGNNKYSNLMDIYYRIKNIKDSNYIISQIDIKEEDINKEIRIINDSFQQPSYLSFKTIYNEQIKKYCEIKINDKFIPFSYFYKFKEKGRYLIKYSFNRYLTKINYMFNDCDKLSEINLSNFNTENVTYMNSMFYNCKSLKEINLSNLNTENVTYMGSMFYNCKSLKELNLSNLNTENVTYMNSMFYNCESLKELNLSNFKTENVTSMESMFYNCELLKELNLSNFKTENVTSMESMFYNCKSLKEINLSNFKTENVTYMNSMFYNCELLKELNLCNFKTENATNMESMFYNCKSLKEINLSEGINNCKIKLLKIGL